MSQRRPELARHYATGVQHVAAELPAAATGTVTAAWYLDMISAHPSERVLPLPWTELIVNLSDPYLVHTGAGEPVPTPPVFLTGIRHRVISFGNPQRIRHLALRLEPWTPVRLGVVPADGITAVPGPLATALQAAVGPLSEALDDGAAQAAADRLLAALLDRLQPAGRAVQTVMLATELLRDDPTRPLAEVAAAVGLSHKTLIAHFRAVVGHPPGRFARLLLLHDLVARVPADGRLANWAALVADSGFADQSHFIRVFREATGLSPRGYLRLLAGSHYGDQRFLGEDTAG